MNCQPHRMMQNLSWEKAVHRSDFCGIQTGLALQKEETRETEKQLSKTFYSLVA